MSKIWILFLIVALVSCRLEEKERTGPLHIVATTGIIEDALYNIVGDSAEVSALMGPGTDPHLYRPTPGDIELLDQADVIVTNGLHLEGKMAEMLQKYGLEKPVLNISDAIPVDEIIKSADFADSYDPHIWFDSKIWIKGLAGIVAELGEIEPSQAAYFSANFDRYKKKVEAMDLAVQADLDLLTDHSKVLITSHDAFSYFGRRYGIEVRGIQGISTLSEVGLKDISAMVDFVIERQIKAIFVETSTSNKTAQSIVDGCAAKGYSVALLGPLYSDALAEPDSEAGTYTGMVKANVKMIVEGLK